MGLTASLYALHSALCCRYNKAINRFSRANCDAGAEEESQMDIKQYMEDVGRNARAASRLMAKANTGAKNAALNAIADGTPGSVRAQETSARRPTMPWPGHVVQARPDIAIAMQSRSAPHQRHPLSAARPHHLHRQPTGGPTAVHG